jgi:hypothetical protein
MTKVIPDRGKTKLKWEAIKNSYVKMYAQGYNHEHIRKILAAMYFVAPATIKSRINNRDVVKEAKKMPPSYPSPENTLMSTHNIEYR